MRVNPPFCSRLYREVIPPCRRWAVPAGWALRLFACAAFMIGGVQWGIAVEIRRERVIEHQQELRMTYACHPELGTPRPPIADLWYPTSQQ